MKLTLKTWGANNYGQLGIGSISEQCNRPTEVFLENDLQTENIRCITGGGGQTVVLDKYGSLYGCGLNNTNQLALPGKTQVSKFTKLDSLVNHYGSQVACGWESTFLVTIDGHLLAWGSNTYGQLGISKESGNKATNPIQLPVQGVAQVSSGLRHTAVLLNDGKMLVTGQGRKGQLGITIQDGSPLSETDCLQHVSVLDNVRSVACGQNHTIALTSCGRLFAWGDNKHGQLGLNPVDCKQALTPQLIASDVPPTTKLYAGWTHSVFLKDDGTIINCGRNSYGQLGSPVEMRSDNWTLSNTHLLNKKVHQIAVGSEHNVIISDDGEVLTWGWNEHGNCGLGNVANVFAPTNLNVGKRAVLIGTGSAHCFAIVYE